MSAWKYIERKCHEYGITYEHFTLRTDKITIINGYRELYRPEHHRAAKHGMVYEHIIRAEEMLGRKLGSSEIVHHKDKNRSNNSYDNLMVFKTISDHTAFHNGLDAIQSENGSWYCPDIKSYLICPICGKSKSANAKICLECYSVDHAKNIPEKEVLNTLIYKYSFERIGKMYGVSGKAVSKWCKKYRLPYKKKNMYNKVS